MLSPLIELQPHHANWTHKFRLEAASVFRALAGLVTEMEHIGSTSTPDLAAKPVIDLAARAAVSADPFNLSPALNKIAYQQHTAGPRNHAVYLLSDGSQRSHILHVLPAEQWAHCNQRIFRDKLLHDASARHKYQVLKQPLATVTDGGDYTAAKQSLIEELLNVERAARGLTPTTAWDK